MLEETPGDASLSKPQWGFAMATSVGMARETNQDLVALAMRPGRPGLGPVFIGVLADGMGGMEGGREAAVLSCATFLVETLTATNQPVPEILRGALRRADEAVHARFARKGGAALVAFLLTPSGLSVCNVGDTRAYSLTAGGYQQLTHDDTVAGQLLAAGREPEPATSHELLQYVGYGPAVQPHLSQVAEPPDRIVLTSDGAHGGTPALLDFVLKNTRQPSALATRLLTISDWEGGRDNATVLAVDVRSLGQLDQGSPPGCRVVWTLAGSIVLPPHLEHEGKRAPSVVERDVGPQNNGKPKNGKKRRSAGNRAKESDGRGQVKISFDDSELAEPQDVPPKQLAPNDPVLHEDSDLPTEATESKGSNSAAKAVTHVPESTESADTAEEALPGSVEREEATPSDRIEGDK